MDYFAFQTLKFIKMVDYIFRLLLLGGFGFIKLAPQIFFIGL